MKEDIVYIKTNDEIFLLKREKACQSKFFETMLKYCDTKNHIEVDLDSYILNFIIEHMITKKLTNNISFYEKKIIYQMADYLLYDIN
jgi:hypothetical protein